MGFLKIVRPLLARPAVVHQPPPAPAMHVVRPAPAVRPVVVAPPAPAVIHGRPVQPPRPLPVKPPPPPTRPAPAPRTARWNGSFIFIDFAPRNAHEPADTAFNSEERDLIRYLDQQIHDTQVLLREECQNQTTRSRLQAELKAFQQDREVSVFISRKFNVVYWDLNDAGAAVLSRENA